MALGKSRDQKCYTRFFVVVVKGMEEIGREKTEENVFLWCVWIEEKIKKEGKKIFYKSFVWFVKGRKRKNIVVPFNVIEKIKYYTCKLYEEVRVYKSFTM